MTVYIEYAFAENFLIDFALLSISGHLVKAPVAFRRACFGALVGAFFALLFPLMRLSFLVAYLLKTAVGVLMCLLSIGRVKYKKGWGVYASNVLSFFFCTFAYAGVLSYVPAWFSPLFVCCSFALFAFACVVFAKTVYAKRKIHRFLYDCELYHVKRSVRCKGYLDSGNVATKDGLPICFLSPDIAYDLLGERLLDERGDEAFQISTINGDKTYALYLGALQIENRKKRVYFALAPNMVTRDYKVLLPVAVMDVEERTEKKWL